MENHHLNYVIWFITELASDESTCKVCHLLRQEYPKLECDSCPLMENGRWEIEQETHGLLN